MKNFKSISVPLPPVSLPPFSLILISALVLLSLSQSLAANRTALIIGNSKYKSAPLANPVNDARDMAAVLKSLGFDVILKLDADKGTMKEALRAFKKKLSRSEIGLFYYAGHGMQINGTNYLIPVKNNIMEEWEVESEALGAGRFLAAMQAAGNPMNIVILDACRDNPFKRSFRTSAKGLARMDAPPGTVIAYATSAGSVAADGTGRNGTYTAALLKNIQSPGMDVQKMFNQTGLDVMHKTGNTQVPWLSTSPIPEYFLAGGTATVDTPAPQSAPRNTGSLAINSTPPGADIFLDNRFRGSAPVSLNGIEPGTYKVRADKTGYAPEEKTIQVNAGRKAMVTFFLDKKVVKPKLYVNTDPRAAQIRILNIAQAYHDGIALDPGRYHIEVSKPGYETKKQWVEMSGTQGVDLHVTLAEKTIHALSGKRAGDTFTEPATGMEFVWVEGGCFQMGDTFGGGDDDEKPVHRVCVDGFWMGRYEVTQGQWQKIMGSNPSRFKNGNNHPVERVSWNDCRAFIRELNSRSGRNFRLPYEAEWEYAARSGGKNEKYSGGNNIDRVAWYSGNSGRKTHPVGTKAPNGLGIYDMSGNVWEWCQDWYGKDYYRNSPQDNPQGPPSGSYRVERGGSWYGDPRNVRAANRHRNSPDGRYGSLGFRLLLPSGQ